jgi:hypothetical protein
MALELQQVMSDSWPLCIDLLADWKLESLLRGIEELVFEVTGVLYWLFLQFGWRFWNCWLFVVIKMEVFWF